MKTIFAKGGAGIDSLTVRETASVAPRAGEAAVRLKAATLNFRDLLFITGRLPDMTKQPEYIPLSCAAGEVIAIGEGVTRVGVGDRVSPIFALGWLHGDKTTMDMLGGFADGVARQEAVFPADSLVRLPDTLGAREAATLPCAGLTAWSAVMGKRSIRPSEWVLALGTGGVSLAALQWARAAGAKVAITSSSDAKLARAAALGADLTVNYRTLPDWAAKVRRATGGVDIVVDTVGTGSIAAAAGLVNEGGIVAAIGMLDGTFSWGENAAPGVTTVPIGVGNRDAHEAMLAFAAEHAIRPVVDIVYDLDRLADAYRHLESQQFFGKIGINLF